MLQLDTGNNRFHASMHQPSHADDTGSRIFLWRSGRAQERARHHDSELCLDGLDDGDLVFIWLSLPTADQAPHRLPLLFFAEHVWTLFEPSPIAAPHCSTVGVAPLLF